MQKIYDNPYWDFTSNYSEQESDKGVDNRDKSLVINEILQRWKS